MAFYCPACLPPTNPCLIYLTLTIKPRGVIHTRLSAALLKHGGEMAVGNSRPLYRSSATLSYLHLSFHETFDIISSKYYFFDVGIVSALQGRPFRAGTSEFGEAFETFLMHELACRSDYFSGAPLSFWRSTSGFEVDFIIGYHTAVEVKAKENVSFQDLKSLRVLGEEKQLKY